MPPPARQAPLGLVKKTARHHIKRLPDVIPPRVKVLLRIERVKAGEERKHDVSDIGRTPKNITERDTQKQVRNTAYVRHKAQWTTRLNCVEPLSTLG